MWDERYSAEGYAYGTEPNDFLTARVGRLPPGRMLCLGEGEGRNAVWLARQGFEVTAVDASAVGLAKAERLADRHGVHVRTVHPDLAHCEIEPGAWDGIVSIFLRLPPRLRARVHFSTSTATTCRSTSATDRSGLGRWYEWWPAPRADWFRR